MPLDLSVRSRPGAWLLIQASGLLAEQRAAALSPRLRVSPPGLVTKTLPRLGWSSPGLPSPAISRRQTTPPALCAGLSHASRLVPETRRMVHGQKRAGQLRAGRAPQALPQGSSGIRQHLCLEPSPPPSPPERPFSLSHAQPWGERLESPQLHPPASQPYNHPLTACQQPLPGPAVSLATDTALDTNPGRGQGPVVRLRSRGREILQQKPGLGAGWSWALGVKWSGPMGTCTACTGQGLSEALQGCPSPWCLGAFQEEQASSPSECSAQEGGQLRRAQPRAPAQPGAVPA